MQDKVIPVPLAGEAKRRNLNQERKRRRRSVCKDSNDDAGCLAPDVLLDGLTSIATNSNQCSNQMNLAQDFIQDDVIGWLDWF